MCSSGFDVLTSGFKDFIRVHVLAPGCASSQCEPAITGMISNLLILMQALRGREREEFLG
jgi:hypothetical protein